MQHYCVIGYPIGHSLSPEIHNCWFRAAKISAKYEACEVTPRDLAKFMRSFRERYSGANVTIPHKETVIKFLDALSPEARRIGAVNTIVNRRGKLVGYNTDAEGAISAIGKGKMKNSIVLGAGGAARAIVYGLRKAGTHVAVLNRTVSHAKKLAKEFGCEFGSLEDFEDFAEAGVDLIVNATSVGMERKTPLPQLREVLGVLDKKTAFAPRAPAVMDIVYRPRMTRLLRDAKVCGCRIITGDKMFLAQAAKSFELWTGARPKIQHKSDFH